MTILVKLILNSFIVFALIFIEFPSPSSTQWVMTIIGMLGVFLANYILTLFTLTFYYLKLSFNDNRKFVFLFFMKTKIEKYP